jgi:Zn-dependent protease with chaperone function
VALAFTCPECHARIVVGHLGRGEQARCRACGAQVTVPDDAQDSDDVPDYRNAPSAATARARPGPVALRSDSGTLGSEVPRPIGPTRAEFRALIQELTDEAEQNPAGYQRRVLWMVCWGYARMFGVLLLIIGLLALIIVIAVTTRSTWVVLKPAAALAVIAFAILRSLWVHVPEPRGEPFDPREAPALGRLIEEVRSRVAAPRVDQVLITRDFNAAIHQRPTLGFLGGYRSYLVLGLPLMEALSPDQFRAVLAHEFGHLSRKHGWFGAWIVRMRLSWHTLYEHLEHQKTGWDLFRGFFVEFMPRFEATTFVLARRHEYEADRMSADLVGSRTAGSALIRIAILDRLLGECFWPEINRLLETSAEPPSDLADRQAVRLRVEIDPATASSWLDEELRRATDLDDTHPCLSDRLAALAVTPSETAFLETPSETAADHFLGADRAAALRRNASAEWLRRTADSWSTAHRHQAALRRNYLDLQERASAGTLNPDERRFLCDLHQEYGEPDAAVQLATAAVEADPNDIGFRQQLGRALLRRGDEAGLEQFRHVVEVQPALAVEACADAYEWLFARGRKAEADAWHERGLACAAWHEKGRLERLTVSPADVYLPAKLSEDLVVQFRGGLATVPGIDAAWIVQKEVTVVPEDPALVLFVRAKLRHLPIGRQARARKILQEMATRLPSGPILHVVLNEGSSAFEKKLGAVRRARML